MTTDVATMNSERFVYASYPRPLYYSSYKNIADAEKPFYGNVMYDKRVVRGNTWALKRMAQEALMVEEQEMKKSLKQKRNSLREQIQAKLEAHRKAIPNVPKKINNLNHHQQQQLKNSAYDKKATSGKKPGKKIMGKSGVEKSDNSSEKSLPDSALEIFDETQRKAQPNNNMQISQTDNVDKKIVELPSQNTGILRNENFIGNQENSVLEGDVDKLVSGESIGDKRVIRNTDVQQVIRNVDIQRELIALSIIAKEEVNRILSYIEGNDKILLDNQEFEEVTARQKWDNLEKLAEQSDKDNVNDNNNRDANRADRLGSITEEVDIDRQRLSDMEMAVDSGDKENSAQEKNYSKLLSTYSQADLYPLPQIESTSEEDEEGEEVSQEDDELASSDVVSIWLRETDEVGQQQMGLALRAIVDKVMSTAENEIQYEIEIQMLRNNFEEIQTKNHELRTELIGAKNEISKITKEKQSLLNEINGDIKNRTISSAESIELEKEKAKFNYRQMSWDLIHNDLLPGSLEKLIQNDYITVGDVIARGSRDGSKSQSQLLSNKELVEKENMAALQKSIKDDFMPWLFTEVVANVAHTTFNVWLNDAIDLKNEFCRQNAKTYVQSALETLKVE